jgi:D-Tyr-tRNAtyr deacylase
MRAGAPLLVVSQFTLYARDGPGETGTVGHLSGQFRQVSGAKRP